MRAVGPALAIARATGQRLTPARPWGFVKKLLRVRLAAVGLGIVLLFAAMAALGDLVAPYDPLKTNLREVLRPPTLAHPLGTDVVGRDTLSRIILGSRIALEVGLISVGVALVLGVPLGLVAGYYRGLVDDILMRAIDAMYSFPTLILALGILAALGPGIQNVMIALGVVFTPSFARIVRSLTLSIRETDYAMAARALGVPTRRILYRHILPNALAPIIVQGSLAMAFAILAEAGLSFLGVGVEPPTPSWGAMLNQAYGYLARSPYASLFPGMAITLLVLGLNFLGDALRDVLDPRLGRALGLR
ncbi:MAG: ABC transporter permease [Chloroflexi bacterium]|nr:ABC transporter permease [Chloroflexota bacterium]